jgi:hypothetical protein
VNNAGFAALDGQIARLRCGVDRLIDGFVEEVISTDEWRLRWGTSMPSHAAPISTTTKSRSCSATPLFRHHGSESRHQDEAVGRRRATRRPPLLHHAPRIIDSQERSTIAGVGRFHLALPTARCGHGPGLPPTGGKARPVRAAAVLADLALPIDASWCACHRARRSRN